MENLSKQIIAWLFIFSLTILSAQAQQQFKWVTGGGTTQDFSIAPSNQWEQTDYMCTDANGNVYALSQVGDNPIYADTFIRLSGAYGADNNILLTSYNCNGQMRWAKIIANDGLGSFASGITSDELGNIYVSGLFKTDGGSLYIGYDTTLSGASIRYLTTALIQFDTNGHFNWIRFVGANTFASELATDNVSNPIASDGVNNIHYFCYISTGIPLMPGDISIEGVDDITYNTAGTLLSIVRLDIDSEWYLNAAVIDPTTNKLYVSGQIATGGSVTDSFYAAAFGASRNLLWQYFCGHGDDDGITGVTIDQSKKLYFSGAAQGTAGMPTPAFSFNGDSVITTSGDLAIIMKTDTNGHPEWIKHFDGSLSVNSFNSITLLPNNNIAATGTYAGTLRAGTISITTTGGQNPYFVVVDSGGNLVTLQQPTCDGFYNGGFAIVSDKVGNIYLGGEVADSIFGGTIPAYHTYGGNTDFFVMKYGVDCSCTSGPTAAYTDTGTHHTIGVTYTGTTTGLDSVIWSFGDGSRNTGTTATHTYTDTGTYNVCVTTYTDCGIDEHCSSFVYRIDTPSLVGSPAIGGIQVFPNPANDVLNITGLKEKTSYRLLSITGTCVLQGSLQQPSGNIFMHDIVPGVYVLELTSADGERNIARVVKQ